MFKLKNKLMMGGGMNGCFFYGQNQSETPVLQPNPDVVFNRTVYMNGSITMDDGNRVTIWGFHNGNGARPFPSPIMRLTQGQYARTALSVGMMLDHTIHHHGIEPGYRSDGVGHTSWDISGNYTYQWRPSQAGTYFYHCHTNTVLHAEMGMYGPLIVDPPAGWGTAFTGGPTYDVEAIWAVDEIDPVWHSMADNKGYTAGTCGEDVGLNTLNPQYFIISGVDGSSSAADETRSSIPAVMNLGQTLLIRYINAGYLPQRLRLGGGLSGEIIASDGHPFVTPVAISQLDTVSAERYDIIIRPTSRGVYPVEFDIQDWVTGQILGTARTKIIVN